MSTVIAFTKMVGTGNDFIVVDARRHALSSLAGRWARVARSLCDRHEGIGADGLLLLESSTIADAKMRVFNPDGSEADMCGNGARCVAFYLVQTARRGHAQRIARSVSIETRAGVLSARVRGERVALAMTDPSELKLRVPLRVGSRHLRLGCLNTGVPHAVVPMTSVDAVDVNTLGRALRRHAYFAPRGTNVNFIQPHASRPNTINVRTYERGVEHETLACGTGLAASAVIYVLSRNGVRTLRAGSSTVHRVNVEPRSGERLTVSFRVTAGGAQPRVRELVLEGRARRICDGTLVWPMKGVR